MILSEFNRLCINANIPAISLDQWNELMHSSVGDSLSNATSPADLPMSIELCVRCVSPSTLQHLTTLGLSYDLEQLVRLSQSIGKSIFVALYKAQVDSQFRTYLDSIGFVKVKPLVPPYYSFHVYGNKGALCISEAQTRKCEHTINIEGALALSARVYDWPSKIRLQLSATQLIPLLSVLNGHTRTLSYGGYGTNHDKAFEVKTQDMDYFFRLIQRGCAPVSVPMPIENSLNLISLLYQQIQKNHPHLNIDQITLLEKRFSASQHTPLMQR